jgi:dTDP-4-dehydrorhamnose 3,5-epimerase
MALKVIDTAISDVKLIAPRIFGDERGFFFECWNQKTYSEAGIDAPFVQDNHSRSSQGVLRGLHYQIRHSQGKLIRVVAGSVFDVAVDLRRSSPTFGKWVGAVLSAENKMQFWIPPGFAHGFLCLEDGSEFLYKCTDFYAPEYERSLLWNDPALGIEWPIDGTELILSAKDAAAKPLAESEVFP